MNRNALHLSLAALAAAALMACSRSAGQGAASDLPGNVDSTVYSTTVPGSGTGDSALTGAEPADRGHGRGNALGISVEPDVFAEVPGESRSNEFAVVTGAPSPKRSEAALLAAAGRFSYVTEHGAEDRTIEQEDDPPHTPNAVIVLRSPGGPIVYVDSKSFIPGPMRQELIKILLEELKRAGVTRGTIRTPSDEELLSAVPIEE